MADINILSETRQVSWTRPGEPKIEVALMYQVNTGVPRTVFVDEDKLPDRVYLRTHPDEKAAHPDLVRQGDKVRVEAIKADIARIQAQPTVRKLTI